MVETVKKTRKNNKSIDLSKYRIYTVTQQIFIGDRFYEGDIILYGKDEDIQLPKNIRNTNLDDDLFKKIKGHIAVLKGTHIQKHHLNINRFNKYIKELKDLVIKL